MPDEPVTTSPPAPTPAPTPQASKPTTPPTQPTTDLDPSQVVQVPGPDGNMVLMTLGEMAAKAVRTGPEIDPEKLKRLELFEKSASGDTEATRKLMETYLPPAEPAKVKPEDRIQQLEQQVANLSQTLTGKVVPLTEQIEEVRHHGVMRNIIEQHKDKLPYLAHNPQSASMVVEAFKNQLRAMNMDGNSPQAMNVLVQTLANLENYQKSVALLYSGFKPTATPATPVNKSVVVDDQQHIEAAHIPARLAVIGGRLVDERGRPVIQNASGQFVAIPDQPITGVPSGTAVAGIQAPKGPITREEMNRMNRERLAAARGGGQ